MQTRRVSALSIAPAIASALLAIGVMTVFSACGLKDDGTWMHCHDAQLAVAGCAMAVTVLLVIAVFVRNGKAQAAWYALSAIGSVVVFLLPGTIMPMCMMQTMRCYTVMQPFAHLMAAVIFALCALCAIRALRDAGGRSKDGQRPESQ